MTSGPDFGEGDYSKTSHTQDELVLELSVDHLRTIGGVVVVMYRASLSLAAKNIINLILVLTIW